MPASDANLRKPPAGRNETEGDEDAPSLQLWVGNLAPETTDADLMAAFAKHGALLCIIIYGPKNFAFIYFKNLDDACAARNALQGHVVCGRQIKINFARPAKPAKHLLVGGISSSITKEQLEREFSKFGKIEEFKFLRDRNCALVNYLKLEDAVIALKNMNRKSLGGEEIGVDYLRSQPSQRENWSDLLDLRDGRFNNRKSAGPPEMWMPPDFPESSQFALRRHPSSQQFGGQRGDGQPSNILWIGYPPSVQIDEQMLHNAMILFGEIERIKSFPSRHYSFVEFRSVDEARRAKEGLQGRLFNDPRIQIMFSSSDLTPGKDFLAFYPGIRGPRPDMFSNEPPFRPGHMELFGHARPVPPNKFPGPVPPGGMPRQNMFMRPFGPHGFDPSITGPEFNDMPAFLHNLVDANRDNPMAANWRRPSPTASGMLPSPLQGMQPPSRPMHGRLDEFDVPPFQREPKRSRMDVSVIGDMPSNHRQMDGQGTGDSFGLVLHVNRGPSGSHGNVQSQIHQSPEGLSRPSIDHPVPAERQGLPDNDHCWRGVIAKGGTPVCHARCIPIGKGIDSQLPETVNCSARTGLDVLAKHYAEAIGFDIVFFLPDSEEDFAPYTEFLLYLGMKNRAGVAKFDDGTTLFLVPPSDFLTKVLKVPGPERLYGLVLKMPQQPPSVNLHQPQQLHQPLLAPRYIDRQEFLPPQTDYNSVPEKEDQGLQMDCNRGSYEGSLPHSGGVKPPLAHPNGSHPTPPASSDYVTNQAVPPQSGVSLTPELIATLAALIPTNTQSPSSNSGQLSLSASVRPTSISASVTPDKFMPSQGWRQENQAVVSGSFHNVKSEEANHPSQQLGHEHNNQAALYSQFATYANVSNRTENSAQAILGGSQVHDPSLNIQQATVTTKPMHDFGIPSQGGLYTASQANQLYQFDASQNPQNYGALHAADTAAGVFQPLTFSQLKPVVPQVQSGGLFQPQIGMPLATDKVNTEFPNQVQLRSPITAASGQGMSESDSNQKFQSTLQLAHSLLLQLQQQPNAQGLHGSSNQQ